MIADNAATRAATVALLETGPHRSTSSTPATAKQQSSSDASGW
ncbi:MAG: hypothetical protein R3A10_11550 [Caldilineaceae bacterium]